MVMKKLFFKSVLYIGLTLFVLEGVVRIFHLNKDSPSRYVDANNVEKWVPNQEGYAVTGNRRQNFSEYHINNFGYNSYRTFKPTLNKVEIALVGDSFIEGFHQHYYNSIGKKIENKLEHVEVYEYGYAGYDFADQLHLINAYKADFDLIDYVILGLKFENDLTRGTYTVIEDRMRLESRLYKTLRYSKLLVYVQSIGALDPVKDFVSGILSPSSKNMKPVKKTPKQIEVLHAKYKANFDSLTTTYGYDKTRFILLLDTNKTPKSFLNHLKQNDYKYIDFYETLSRSKTPTTLIYDKHWNNHGRNLIAACIVEYLDL